MEKPIMSPAPGERLVRFVGDTIRFSARLPGGGQSVRAFLRTNLGKASTLRREIISSYAGKRPLSIDFWRDIPLPSTGDHEWGLELPLTEVGFFGAKAYLVDPNGRQVWPDGPDAGISVHPDAYRTGNTIYCAFPRMFGPSKDARSTRDEALDKQLVALDKKGYAVIPPSGTLRDLKRELPHIFDRLGCRILHLLPVNPTPTTFARMGRFGSPYACQDLVAIDPALVEFDRRSTGVDQFCELTYAVHHRGGRVFLDVVINHTGWGSTLHENHPEWFVRDREGTFVSPGAWGTVWADLVELNPRYTALWEHLADGFLVWCRRGVDGFRCDAGYKVPLPVWQYIVARVRDEFPNTVFLLEGLGGSWEATERLLTEGGMQWAYSELFQNYTAAQVASYLDYSLRQSERAGLYVHYSETHDNDRLAKRGKTWALLRNRLCALASVNGAYGFTCGVEWLATEKINVHASRGLSWGAQANLVEELSDLNALLAEHPCFFDGARLTRLSSNDSPVFALHRAAFEDDNHVLVLVNTDDQRRQRFELARKTFEKLGSPVHDLLGATMEVAQPEEGNVAFLLDPGAAICLAGAPSRNPAGAAYRSARARAAFALQALGKVLAPESIGAVSWQALAERINNNASAFLAALPYLNNSPAKEDLCSRLDAAAKFFPQVVEWDLRDQRRITPVPAHHWLLIKDPVPFRAALKLNEGAHSEFTESVAVKDGHVACFAPRAIEVAMEARLTVQCFGPEAEARQARLRYLPEQPQFRTCTDFRAPEALPTILLTNGTGGMARLNSDLGRITSKYDTALGANLHDAVPVDRHVFAKRIRVWVNADGFITPLDAHNLSSIHPGPPALWEFRAKAGDERTVLVQMHADMMEGRNTTVFTFSSPMVSSQDSRDARDIPVSLSVRVDIEDRNFHAETQRNPGADVHFATHSHPLPNQAGFIFSPVNDRQLRVFATSGRYHHEAEWCEGLQHPVEQSRGQTGSGDAYSPGWFEFPLSKNASMALVLCADADIPTPAQIDALSEARVAANNALREQARIPASDSFGAQLAIAAKAFVVRRGTGKTVIAGYPWFLDWGRDSLICARGLLSAGWTRDVTELLLTFGHFVDRGTMPNTIHGDDASNRETSDAPLWYGVVCEEATRQVPELPALRVDNQGRSVADVLRDIAIGYYSGTPNGIQMDRESALIWSPSHFTWMDTNYPAATPREGYPIEIQVLWISLLKQLARLQVKPDNEPWQQIAERAERHLRELFWLEDLGYPSDLLIASRHVPARTAIADTALRSNYLFAITFGVFSGEKAQRAVAAALRHLMVPGALRSLAPLPVDPPLPVRSPDGRLLNNPDHPYWGHYQGDEDTQRKPAYHNGTAWTWTLPVFCEALVKAWEFSPQSIRAAKAYLGGVEKPMREACLGQVPELLDGDSPHQPRGCDAQAWGVTEALRVWKILQS